MDSKILNRISNFSENDKGAFKKKALIYSYFLAISFAFWFINALSDYYTTEIKYPIKYKNFPNQKVQIGNPPENLIIKVRAVGYTILRYRFTARYIPISFSVNSFSMNRLPGYDSSNFFLQTIYTREYIANQLSSEFEILDIKPDTLYFRFASMKSKMVPVQPGFDYQLDKQMILKSEPKLIPDSILVSGPDYIMDTLSGLQTENVNLGRISKKTENLVNIMEVKNLYIKINKITVIFDIEQSTEKTIQVPVSVIHIPDNLKLQTFPQNVKVTCQVGLSNYEKLQASFFRAQVDYNEIIQTKSGKMKVELVNQPAFVRAVDITPKTVEYLIEK